MGRVFLLLLLTCFSLGVEEAEQEWGRLQATKSGPESSRRGRINRTVHAAHHLYRSAGEWDETGGAFVFDVTPFDLASPRLAASGAPSEMRPVFSRLRAAAAAFNRGPPLRFL